MDQIYHYSLDLLNKLGIKHESHVLQSGVKMIDIWYRDKFYVLQFEKELMGFSDINKENPGFDTIPDEKFYKADGFKNKLKTVFLDNVPDL